MRRIEGNTRPSQPHGIELLGGKAELAELRVDVALDEVIKAHVGSVDEALLDEPQERELYARTQAITPQVHSAIETRDWTGACEALITLKRPIDGFFDHVMVMAEDDAVRHNRLALLSAIRALFAKVADISRIQVD